MCIRRGSGIERMRNILSPELPGVEGPDGGASGVMDAQRHLLIGDDYSSKR